MPSPTAQLRRLLKRKTFLTMPSAYDAITARLIESTGFNVVYNGGMVTGVSTCITEPLVTMTEHIDIARRMAGAVRIPLIMDAGAGWGEPLHAMRTVRETIRAGIAGIHIEDQIYPKRAHYHANVTHIIPINEFRDKIRLACAQRDELDRDFVVIARSDACSTVGYKEAVKRINLAADQGADMGKIFARDHKETVKAPKDAKLPLIYVRGRGVVNDKRRPYTYQQIEDMGYAGVVDAVLSMFVNFHFMRNALRELKRTGDYTGITQEELLSARQGILELIGMEDYYRIERETVEQLYRRKTKH